MRSSGIFVTPDRSDEIGVTRMFDVGEYIVCGRYGVCRVKETGPVHITGAPRKRLYYTLVPVYDSNSRAYVPVDSEKIIMRPVISGEQANELVDHINDIDALWIQDEKKREAAFKEALYKCDCKEWIKIIKTIYRRRQDRIAQGKKVTAGDERYLHMAQDRLYGELAVALGMKKEEVEAFIIGRAEAPEP